MKKELFGKFENGTQVYKYTLENSKCSVSFIDFGAILQSFNVFGRDIVGGFDTFEGYLLDDSHQGGIIGRVANRIENARFTMNGRTYYLPKNDGESCLHGGCGFDRRMWLVKEHKDDRVVFECISESGDQGFPELLITTVTYILDDTALIIKYSATPSGLTPISLTNHSYFNLDDFGRDILNHNAVIYADEYTEADSRLIPIGNKSVSGTVFDFRTPHSIGERLNGDFSGYDHNYILSPEKYTKFCGKELGLAAEVDNGDIKLSVYTDQPCIQFYIGNFLGADNCFKGGIKQTKHGAFCLEAQIIPNGINKGIGFYDNGELYTQATVYKISKI